MGGYSTQAHDLVNSLAIAVANWSTAMAVESVRWLIASLGQATEPDLGAIVPVYDRMLAISLLIVGTVIALRSEEHTSELQSQSNLVCRLLLEKKKSPSIYRNWRKRKGWYRMLSYSPGSYQTAACDTVTPTPSFCASRIMNSQKRS